MQAGLGQVEVGAALDEEAEGAEEAVLRREDEGRAPLLVARVDDELRILGRGRVL